MKWLDTLQHRWSLGFGVLLLMIASLVAWGLGAALVLGGMSLLVPLSVDEWLPLSALIWGPLAVGYWLPHLSDYMRREGRFPPDASDPRILG
jgi:hypothetical protein